MAANLELVPATAGKRLGAAVLDWLGPVAVMVVTFAIGFAGITRTQSGGFIIYDTGSVVRFGGIGLGLTLAYLVVLSGMEARSGITVGNDLMGIRSADKDGYAPGAVRGLITGAGIILTLLAAAAIVILKWFDVAVSILGPMLLLGAVWTVLMVVSNIWDRNGGLRGWHDAAAKTLVFDIKAGRNPITSGGIQGPYSFAPLAQQPPAPQAAPVAHARPDDDLDRSVLVGRNPVGQMGEQQAQLLAVDDSGRSISKTHLHRLVDGAGIWVTDRNSTNGSAVTTPDGLRTPLQPGVPAFVSPGSTVHFGDRSFHLGQA